MANNPYVNKVIYGNDTVMDISDTTATEGDVVSGKTFYKANGAKATGTASLDVDWGDIGGNLDDQTDLADALDECEGRSYKLTRSALGYTPQNFIPDEYDFDETTINGITFNAEKDGSITLSGIATADATVTIASNVPLGKANYTYKYYLNLQETDKSTGSVYDSNIILSISKSGASASVELNGVLEYTMASADAGNYNVTLKVKSGTNLSSGVYNVYPAILWDEPINAQLERTSKKTDSIVTNISDGDYVPVYVTNSVAKGGAKITWENIKAKLKAFFDSIYPKEIEVLLKDTVGWVGKNEMGWKIGYAYSSSTGELVALANCACSRLIPVKEGDKFRASKKQTFSASTNGSMIARYLNASKQVVDANVNMLADASLETETTIPSGVAYIGVTQFYPDGNMSQSVLDTYEIMLCSSEISDKSYEPYHKPVSDVITDVYGVMGENGAKNKINVRRSDVTRENYCQYTPTETGVRLYTSQNSAYSDILVPINIAKNTDYILTSHIDFTSGSARAQIRYSDDGTNWTALADVGVDISSDTDIALNFNSGNHPYYQARLFCTRGTSVAGDVTYENLMIRDARDTNPDFEPYAMTNKELTDELATKEGSITTNFTFGNVHTVRKYGKVVELNLQLTGIENVTAYSTAIAQISNGFRPNADIQPVSFLKVGSEKVVRGYIKRTTGEIQLQEGVASGANAEFRIFATWITS